MSLTLPPLPYAIEALEPHQSRHTLAVHHGQHHAAYVAKVNALVAGTPLASATLVDIVKESASRNRRLFNAAAQAWNHEFFWNGMRPNGGGAPVDAIAALIDRDFGSHAAFAQKFVTVASDHFGSGWVWLVLEDDRLRIVSTDNAETPLVGSSTALLTLDVWEHAYYLDYQQRRLDYIGAFLGHLVDWDAVNRRLAEARRR